MNFVKMEGKVRAGDHVKGLFKGPLGVIYKDAQGKLWIKWTVNLVEPGNRIPDESVEGCPYYIDETKPKPVLKTWTGTVNALKNILEMDIPDEDKVNRVREYLKPNKVYYFSKPCMPKKLVTKDLTT